MHLDDDRAVTEHPRAHRAVRVRDLHLDVGGARRRIDHRRDADDLGRDGFVAEGIEIDVRVLSDGDAREIALGDGDECTEHVDLRDGEDAP